MSCHTADCFFLMCFFGLCFVFVLFIFLTCKLWEPPFGNWPAGKSSPWAFNRKAFAAVDHSGCLTSARLTLKEKMIRDRYKILNPINRISTSYSRAKCLKFRPLLPCVDLCAWCEDLRTSQRQSCRIDTLEVWYTLWKWQLSSNQHV